jgi:uncharacterized membrane protein YhaH (DUF805 family)
MNEYLSVLKNYAKFDGRARRREFWMFVLFNAIAGIVAGILDRALNLTFSPMSPYGYIYAAYSLAVLVPSIAVAIRRLHDIGKSGWWLLIVFVPIIGGIWLLVLLVTKGQSGSNAYGADPKA